jgi:hypothetical protein
MTEPVLTHSGGALGFVEGTVTLSAASAPHVDASYTVTLSDPELLNTTLNPMQSPAPRVQLEVEGRTFDLHVRDAARDQDDTTRATLNLASDEALLSDYRALADDATPLTFQDSLRDLVEYVLDTVLPGTTLEPGDDVAVPALIAATNLVRNPRRAEIWDWQYGVGSGSINDGQYLTGGPAYAPTFYYFGATGGDATDAYHYYDEANLSVRGDTYYRASVDIQVPTGLSAVIDAVMIDSSGNVVGFASPRTVTGASGVWKRRDISFWTKPTTARIRPRVIIYGTLPNGVYINVTAWRVSEDTGDAADIEYFDGLMADDAYYSYEFTDDDWASPSERTPLIDAAEPDALIWLAGQTALDFLAPLIQRFGLRLVCDELRQWTLRGEEYLADGAIEVRYGVNMQRGAESVGRDAGVWFDARVTRYRSKSMSGAVRDIFDVFALNDPPTLVTLLELDSPYPGPGRSEYAVRRAQGRQREVTASRKPTWTEAAEQSVSIVLEGAPTQTGKTQAVTFNIGENEVSITTRTVDTPLGAIDLLTGSINSLAGTIDSL